jgi:hypothetical protein
MVLEVEFRNILGEDMNTHELLKINLFVAHDVFSKTVADVTQEMADWMPPGVALPIGERIAHTIAAEDMMINRIARGGDTWYTTTWADKSGLGAFDLFADTEAKRAFRADVNALREYQNAVFSETQAYLDGLSEGDMDRVFDMSFAGYGEVPAPAWWSAFVIGHLHDVMGEISALKGCLGVKGYPF